MNEPLKIIMKKFIWLLSCLGLVLFNLNLNLPANTSTPLFPNALLWQSGDFNMIDVEQQGLGETEYKILPNRNWFQGTFPALSWEAVKNTYREPDLSKQKPGNVLRLPCSEIRPDNFNRVHNLMVLGISECGFITTYENYDNPEDNKLVHLFYIKLPALAKTKSGRKASPLIFLTGGPGQANTGLAAGGESTINALRENRDYIFIDYRGTGMSLPTLGCLPEMMAMYLSHAGYAQNKQADKNEYPFISSCRTRLENKGINTLHYSTRNIVRDLKVAVRVLGYKKANFQGVSYGTKIGLILLRDHPEIVRSIVLDSIFPVEADGLGETATTLFNPLDEMVDVCKASLNCDPKTLVANLEELLRRFEHLANKEKVPQTRGSFLEVFKVLSLNEFIRSDWPMELEFLLSLSENELQSFMINRLMGEISKYEIMYQYFGEDLGNLESIVEPGETRTTRGATDPPAPLLALSLMNEFVGFWHSINCEEELFPTDFPPRPVYRSRYFSTTLVEKLSNTLQIEMNKIKNNSCGNWDSYERKKPTHDKDKPNVADDALKHAPVKSQIPVLLLSARIDFFTPIGWAKEAKQNLPNSYWYVSDTANHDVGLSDPCAITIMRYFLASPQTFIRQNRKGPTVSCARYPARLQYEMKK